MIEKWLVRFKPYHLVYLVLGILFLYVYQTTLTSLLQRWLKFDEAYGHGILVLLIVCYLVFNVSVNKSLVKSSLWFLIPLTILNILWVLARFMDIIIIQQILLPPIIYSSIALILGNKITLKYFFPIFFLYFAVPIWDYLNDYLILLTSTLVTELVQLSSITALIDGSMITLPYGNIIIADGCSGLRYLIVCTALSSLAAHVYFTSAREKFYIILLGIAIGLFTNWVRVYTLILIGYFTKMESSLINDHELYGWVLFSIFSIPIYLLIYFKASNQPENSTHTGESSLGITNVSIISLLCMLLFSGLMPGLLQVEGKSLQFQEIELQDNIGDWKLTEKNSSNNGIIFSNSSRSPAAYMINKYIFNQENITLGIATYNRGDYSDFLPYRMSIVDNKIWNKLKSYSHNIDVNGKQRKFMLHEVSNNYSNKKSVIITWYMIGDDPYYNQYYAKLNEVTSIIQGVQSGAVLYLMSECNTDCSRAKEIINEFVTSNISKVERAVVNSNTQKGVD